MAPGAVLPDDVEIAEIKRGGLSVRDIGLALLIDHDAARGAYPAGPAKVEHPADHIEHVDAHVAHDSVAIFLECPPATGMHERIVGPHRSRARPHFVVEIRRGRRIGRIIAGSHVVITTDFYES